MNAALPRKSKLVSRTQSKLNDQPSKSLKHGTPTIDQAPLKPYTLEDTNSRDPHLVTIIAARHKKKKAQGGAN